MNHSKTILYIAVSLDGFIAGEEDDLSFLSIVDRPGEDYGYSEFMKGINTIIMGKRTYDWIMQNAPEYFHHEKLTYVITHESRQDKENLKFFAGDLTQLIGRIKRESRKDIFIEGGSEVIHQLNNDRMIDEYIISIIPYILGKGIRLFKGQEPTHSLKLLDVKKYESGLVQIHYLNLNTASLDK